MISAERSESEEVAMGALVHPQKPCPLQVLADCIPAGMRGRQQWVVWQYEYAPNATKPWTKVPYNPGRGYKASHSRPDTWGSFDEALQACQCGRWGGIGYVFSQDDPYCGIDLDDCRNPLDGSISPAARAFIADFNSYTEVSPSGTGLHILIEGRLPAGGRKDSKLKIEVYDRLRYLCFTGQHLTGTPVDPQPRQVELDCIYKEVFGSNGNGKTICTFLPDPSSLTESERHILDQALSNPKTGAKIRLLMDGQYEETGKESQSEGDLALCSYLAFWFNRDPVAVDKVFRASKLYREKWDQKHYGNGQTYGQVTVQKAIDSTKEGYIGKTDGRATLASPDFDGVEPYDIFGETALTGKPEWPLDACPKAIEAFAQDEAERIGVDVAMVALQAIGVAAIAIHDRFMVQPKANDITWKEPPILWIAAVGDPGQKKSPAQKAAKRPLEEIGHELHTAYKEDIAQYRRDLSAWKQMGEQGEPPQKPVQPRLYVDDTTVEALRRVLDENPRGVGVVKDELSGWLASFDAYRSQSKGGSKDRADYCELYQGGPKWFDRAEKGAIYVQHWGASIVGNIQPGPVKRQMGNITDDGLIARFLVAHCERRGPGADREPNHVALRTYHNMIRALTALHPQGEAETFTFAPKAQAYRNSIRDLADTVQCLPDTSDALKAHLNKLEGMFCRVALVFHMVQAATAGEYPARQIPETTARMAATLIANFLLANSVRFYAETIDDGSHGADARWVAGYILSRGLETITKRELMQDRFKSNTKALTATMNALFAAGWVVESASKRTGEVTAWGVNPAVHIKFKGLAQAERERRETEREKIRQAVEALRNTRRTK